VRARIHSTHAQIRTRVRAYDVCCRRDARMHSHTHTHIYIYIYIYTSCTYVRTCTSARSCSYVSRCTCTCRNIAPRREKEEREGDGETDRVIARSLAIFRVKFRPNDVFSSLPPSSTRSSLLSSPPSLPPSLPAPSPHPPPPPSLSLSFSLPPPPSGILRSVLLENRVKKKASHVASVPEHSCCRFFTDVVFLCQGAPRAHFSHELTRAGKPIRF